MKKVVLYAAIILSIFGLIQLYYAYNIKSNGYIQDDGYVIISDEIYSDLTQGLENTETKNIKLYQVNAADKLYANNVGSVFIGEEKQQINVKYPMYLSDGSSIMNLDNNSELITNDFDKLEGYSDLYLSNGVTFNSNRKQADAEDFILLKLSNSLYINAQKTKISNFLGENTIPMNSIIKFEEESIRFYTFTNGVLIYNSTVPIDGTIITIGTNTYDYEDFLKNLGITKEIPQPVELAEEITTTTELITETTTTEAETTTIKKQKPAQTKPAQTTSTEITTSPLDEPEITTPRLSSPPPQTTTPTEPEITTPPEEDIPEEDFTEEPNLRYAKPTASANQFSPWVYTANSSVTINDPENRLISGAKFSIYKGSKLVLRQSILDSGEIAVGVLQPDTEYTIIGKIKYKNDKNVTIEETFFNEQTIKTLPIEGNLDPLNITFSNAQDLFPNKIQIKDLYIENSKSSNSACPYISRLNVLIKNDNASSNSDITIKMDSKSLVDLKNGEKITWLSSDSLSSNTNYNYTLNLIDKFGNTLPTDPSNIFNDDARTCKEPPEAKLVLETNKIGNVVLNIKVSDTDSTYKSNLHFSLKDANGDEVQISGKYSDSTPFSGQSINLNIGDNKITIENLKIEKVYSCEVFCDYDLEDGKDINLDCSIGKMQFYTAPLSSLGYAYYTTTIPKDLITDTSAKVNSELNARTSSSLLPLMTRIKMKIKAKDSSVEEDPIFEYEFKKEDLDALTTVNENNEIILQIADVTTPGIVLKASTADAFKDGAWEAILNGAKSDKSANKAVIEVTFPTDSLASATIYDVTYETIVSQGGDEGNLTNPSLKASFKTLKKEPWVDFKNAISTTNYFEIFGVNVKDPNDAVVNGKISARITSNGQIIDNKIIKTNELNNSLKFENLKNNVTYTLEFVAIEFNNGYDQSYFKLLYKLKTSFTFTTGESIEGSLSLEQVDYISKTTPPTELYSPDNITNGAYLDSNNVQRSGSTNFYSDYLSISPSTLYLKKDFGPYYGTCFYDSNKNFISYQLIYGMGSIFKSPANAFYVRINGKPGYENTASLTQFTMSSNLIDFDKIETGKRLVNNGTIQDNASYYITDYIPVIENATYLKSQLGSADVIFYNKDKDMVSFNQYDSIGSVFTVPVGTYYARFTGLISQKDSAEIYFVNESKTDFYNAKIAVSLKDKLNSLSANETPQFTLKYYKSNLSPINYSEPEIINYPIKTYVKSNGEICTENVNQIVEKVVDSNCYYKVELIIEVEGQKTVIDTITFSTETAIIPIRTLQDLKDISKNPNGKYHVLNDLDIGATSSILGSTEFNGVLDFQGHRLTKTTSSNYCYLFAYIGTNGVVKNVIVDWNKTYSTYYTSTIAADNNGTISNVIVNINASSIDYNTSMSGIAINNKREGIIENFVICLKQSVYCSNYFGGVSRINDGVIRNGYVYGDVTNESKIIASQGFSSNADHYAIGGICGVNNYNGLVQNVYSLTSIQIQNGSNMQYDGTTIGRNLGTISNMFTTGDRYIFTPASQVGEKPVFTIGTLNGPTVGTSDGRNIATNIFYISDNIYDDGTNSKNVKVGQLALWDVSWYENIIGKANQFIISDSVNLGYFPRVNLPNAMMAYQEFIALPKIIDVSRLKYVSSYVKEQHDDYSIAVLSFENPQYLTVKDIHLIGLSAEIIKQSWNYNIYQVEVKFKNPTIYFSQYEVTDIVCGTSTISIPVYYGASTSNGKLNINVEFYKSVSTPDDWYAINQGLNQNYRVKNDIDFINIDSLHVNIGNGNKLNFTGKIDGGIYDENGTLTGSRILSNMKTGSYATVVFRLYGTISNLTIDGLDCSTTDSAKQSNVGFIREAKNQSLIDGITIMNSKFKGCRYVGGLVAYSEYGQITNSSVINSSFESYDYNRNSLQLGGLIGVSYNGIVNNCFVSDILINSNGVYDCLGIGGLIGYVNGSVSLIDNCYSQGEINNINSNTGGIVGTFNSGVLTHCWSYVNLTSSSEYIGQIVGNANSGSIQYTLSIGDVYTRLFGSTCNHRCIGFTAPNVTTEKNYAYKDQIFNGAKSTEMDDATRLLTIEELTQLSVYNIDVQLGNDFIYTKIINNAMPRLKSVNNTELPYQKDYYLLTQDVSIKVDGMLASGSNDGIYTIQLSVIHPNYTVEQLIFEGLSATQLTVGENGDTTTYTYQVKQENAYDSYMIKAVLRNKSDTSITKEVKTKVVFDDKPIYRRIANINQWQSVMQSYGNKYENFIITGDIDFSLVPDPIINVKVNRLVGEMTGGVMPKLKNLTLTSPAASTSLIAEVVGGFENIEINNINITYNSNSGNNIGVIGICHGAINNIKAQDINIKAQAAYYVGVIGNCTSAISNITMDNITVNNNNSGNYVGGLVGITNSNINNVTASNISINNETNLNISYCGGVVGSVTTGSLNDISIENFKVYGRTYVGGIVGSSANNFETHNNLTANINTSTEAIVKSSSSYVGGVAGQCNTGYTWYNAFDNCSAKNINVSATGDYIGGFVGRMSAGYNVNCTVEDISVSGNNFVGGVSGRDPVKNGNITNVTVKGNEYVGGISGYSDNNSYNTILDSSVTGKIHVGGIAGKGSSYSENHVVRAIVTGNENVGAIAGTIISNTTVNYCGVTDSTVIATNVDGESSLTGSNVGGLVGYADFYGIQFSYVKDTSVSGVNNVGGLAGNLNNGYNQFSLTNASVTATGANAGGLFGYALSFKSGTSQPTTKATRIYFTGTVNAASNAGGVIGLFEKGTSLLDFNGNPTSTNIPERMDPANFYNIIMAGKVNSSDSKASAWANPISGDVGSINYFRIFDDSKVNNASVTLPAWDCTNKPLFVTSQELSTPKTYTDMSFSTNRFNYNGTNPLEKNKLNVIAENVGLAGKDSSFILKTDGLADGSYTVRINGSTVVTNVNISNGVGNVKYKPASAGKNNITFSIDNQSDYSATLKGYLVIASGEDTIRTTITNDIGASLSGYDFTTTPTITIDTSGTYQWYRASTRNYEGVQITNATSSSQRLAGRGYYYASISNGSTTIYTPIYSVDTTCYMPYSTRIVQDNGPIDSYEEGFDSNNKPFDTEDDWYEGGIPVPQKTRSFSAIMGRALFMLNVPVYAVPEPDIYVSGVDCINIEFDEDAVTLSDVNEPTATFTISANGTDLCTQEITERTYSIGYDFTTPLTVVVNKGMSTENYEIAPADLIRSVMTCNDEYYYIKKGGAQSSKGLIPGYYIHLFDGCAINNKGEVYDLKDNSLIKSDVAIELIDTVPLYTFRYDESVITTFKNYSAVTNQGESVIRDTPLIIKNNKMYSLPTDLPIVNGAVIVDSYQKNEYFTLLGTDGKLTDMLNKIAVPKDFKNYDIKEMTNTIDNNSFIVVMRYASGDVYGFNYLTGEKLPIESLLSDISLLNFVGDFVKSKLSSDLTSSASGYQNMDVLKEQLTIVPLDESKINNSVDNSDEYNDDDSTLSSDDSSSVVSSSEQVGSTDKNSSTTTSQNTDLNSADSSSSSGDSSSAVSSSEQVGSTDKNSSTITSQNTDLNSADSSSSSGDSSSAVSSSEQVGSTDKNSSTTTSQNTDLNSADSSSSSGDSSSAVSSSEQVNSTDNNSSTTTSQSSTDEKETILQDEKYVIAYNNNTKKFEVFKLDELLSTEKKILSENQKIDILKSKNIPVDTKTLTIVNTIKKNINGTIAFIIIIFTISVLLVYIAIRKKTTHNGNNKK